jgi:hypothetical protein
MELLSYMLLSINPNRSSVREHVEISLRCSSAGVTPPPPETFSDVNHPGIMKAISSFMKHSSVEGRDFTFDENPVVIKAHSPKFPDLTLIDLPGLIQSSPHEKEIVLNIINRYISHSRTIILAVVAANHALVNQVSSISLLSLFLYFFVSLFSIPALSTVISHALILSDFA